MTKSELIEKLKLFPHPDEGGWFRETYRSEIVLDKSSLTGDFRAPSYRASTSIYFLLDADGRSEPHSVAADETWHFHSASTSGVHIELLVMSKNGHAELVKLGADIARGQVPQFTVPAGAFMCARINAPGSDRNWTRRNDSWVLIAATVAPSFEYQDYVSGDSAKLAAAFPRYSDFIFDASKNVKL